MPQGIPYENLATPKSGEIALLSLKAETRKIEIAGEVAMMALGARLFELAEPGDVITLRGDLGAGKSVLARGFVRAACVRDDEVPESFDVPSPTFTLVQVYEGPEFPIWHFDLYRVEKTSEIWELGFEEALDGGVCLIEWPEHGASALPDERLDLVLSTREGSTVRDVTLTPGPTWEERLGNV